MSADVNQLMTFFYPFAAQLVTGPAMLLTAVVLLWFQIKWATFIGLGILLITTPITSIFMKVSPSPGPNTVAPVAGRCQERGSITRPQRELPPPPAYVPRACGA